MTFIKDQTKFRGNTSADNHCAHCGREVPSRMFIPGHYPGSPQLFIGECCWHLFENEASVSEDGLVISHQIIME